VVATGDDPLLPVEAAERFARACGWSFELHDGAGHFAIASAGWERLADRVHRWLVRSLGEELLLFLDDEDEPE
jgi:hypothetical protein